jgi:solute carrier family 10 (sodium/bile acid cotransporter), member 7
LVQNLLPKFNQKVIVGWNLKKISPFALLILVWQTYDQAFGTGAFKTVKGDNMIFIVFISIALFIIFNVVAFFSSILWLPKEDTISVCYCVPAKTPALGVPLSMTMFVGLNSVLEAKLQIPMVIYQGLQIVGGTLLIQPLRNWIDRDHQNSIVKDRVAQDSV